MGWVGALQPVFIHLGVFAGWGIGIIPFRAGI
jgi:hypothetical protein